MRNDSLVLKQIFEKFISQEKKGQKLNSIVMDFIVEKDTNHCKFIRIVNLDTIPVK